MTEEVPEEWVTLGRDALIRVGEFLRDYQRTLSVALAAVIPAIRAAAIADHYAELTARANAAQTENRARHQRSTRGDQ